MKIVVLTQNDPFYLGDQLNYLLGRLPEDVQIVGCVVFDVSPFGKRESFWAKAIKTLKIFGFAFFVRYGFKFIKSKFVSSNKVGSILEKHQVKKINIVWNINSIESLELIQSFNPDLLVSIAGNQIFKKDLIELAPCGCLNLHTALLPKYRGLMPSFWVLKNDEKYTGVSVFFVDEGIDSGPILVQKKIEIGNRSQESLIRDTKKMGMDAINEAISLIQKGGYTVLENDDEQSTYFSFPTRKDVIEFKKLGKKFY